MAAPSCPREAQLRPKRYVLLVEIPGSEDKRIMGVLMQDWDTLRHSRIRNRVMMEGSGSATSSLTKN